MLTAILQDVWSIESASQELKNNREIGMLAVSLNGAMLMYLITLRGDREIVMKALSNTKFHADLLGYASLDLRNDREIVLTAVRNNGEAIRFVHPNLQNDPEVILTALQSHFDDRQYYTKIYESTKQNITLTKQALRVVQINLLVPNRQVEAQQKIYVLSLTLSDAILDRILLLLN